VVVVSDDGIGIAPDMLDRVFDLFTQCDRTLARTHGGLGVGLTLVRALLRLHGGTVTARSPGIGHGSQFEIRLLFVPEPRGHVEPTQDTTAGPRRILLADDNADAREMLRTLLQMDGHTVTEAGDGATAIRMTVENPPDVLLLDIGLPGMDGFEVAVRVKRLGSRVRLVALSGYGDPAFREHAQEVGFDAYLVKPVAPEEVARVLSAL
jgi:CheY-like chemotaxis protein